MAELHALDLPGGPAFVTALSRAWDAGHAVLPVDQRLPPVARASLLDALRPSVVVTGPNAVERRRDARPVVPGDALVVPTSGSTGPPKGAVLTHDAVEAHAAAVHARLGVDPVVDHWLACLPLAHVGGLGVVTRALVTGTGLLVLPQFDRVELDGWARRHEGHALTSLVPTALDRLDPQELARLRWVVIGGSSDARDRPANVTRTYGLTETGGGVVYDGVPLDGVEVRIVAGEVQVRGGTLLRAYRDGTDPRTPDGWLPTGDLGAIDDDTGRLVVAGRRGDLIVTGGENVWPERVEAALADHPGIAAVAVAGRPDPEWGQRVVAWIVTESGSAPPTLDEVRGHVRERLPAFAAPRQVVVVDALPRTALGKVRRSELP